MVPKMQEEHATKHKGTDSSKRRAAAPLDPADPFDVDDERYFAIQALCGEVQNSLSTDLGENAWYIVLVS